jgi:hypothetical protein
MNIHLIRSKEVSTSLFRAVVEMARNYGGPIKYMALDKDMVDEEAEDEKDQIEGGADAVPEDATLQEVHLEVLSWARLFDQCEAFRGEEKLDDHAVVVLLTAHPNERNWFSSWDKKGKRNFFIQTSMWENLIESDGISPIVYELVSIPLILSGFSNLEEVEKMAHDKALGCPLDYCRDKTDVILRLRTADICPDCREHFARKNIDPALASQVYNTFDGIRKQILFRERFEITKVPSRLKVNVVRQILEFPDLGNRFIHMSPRQFSIYLFLLRHTEGLTFMGIIDYKDEILRYYRRFARISLEPRIINTVDALVYNQDNALSILINTINEKIRHVVGTAASDYYTVQTGRNEVRRINIANLPGLLEIEDFPWHQ